MTIKNQLIERLALCLAKSEGWVVTEVHPENPRMRRWLSLAQACWEEIEGFLEDEGLPLEDLIGGDFEEEYPGDDDDFRFERPPWGD
jgi:hypothetical protein